MIFDYPKFRSERRHGPSGYAAYESYRPWLRDEFDFRCVYCLKRETWGQVTGEFELDHFSPQSISPHLRVDYVNLVYACQRCNSIKGRKTVADPFTLLCSEKISIRLDGSLYSDEIPVRRMILQLDLNSPRLTKWRIQWMRIVSLAQIYDVDLYKQLTGLPDELPILSQLIPPQNDRIEGIEKSWFARRQRGDIPVLS